MNRPALFFFDNGVTTFPNKDGDLAKEPACKWTEFSASRERVAKFKNYGVRLGAFTRNGCSLWLGVIDTDSHESETWVQIRIELGMIPDTPLRVTTGRGRHRYFLLDKPVPKFIHRNGTTIEFRNVGQYVVGPGSVHPSGSVYTPDEWSWNFDEIPFFDTSTFVFDDGSCRRHTSDGRPRGDGYEFPEVVFEPNRHDELFKAIRSLKGLGAERADVRSLVSEVNTNRCRPPLKEDDKFEQWFARAWDLPDRPLERRSALTVDWSVF